MLENKYNAYIKRKQVVEREEDHSKNKHEDVKANSKKKITQNTSHDSKIKKIKNCCQKIVRKDKPISNTSIKRRSQYEQEC